MYGVSGFEIVPVKGQIVMILGSVDHVVSVTTIQLCHYNTQTEKPQTIRQ